jgi:hypothetical protein
VRDPSNDVGVVDELLVDLDQVVHEFLVLGILALNLLNPDPAAFELTS